MMVYLVLLNLMFFSGLLVFASKRKHLLLMLLSLEFIVLSLYLNLFVYMSLMNYEYFFSMIFLTMSVCEGALGLSILVSMIRTCGNDYMLTFSSLW
uniref:NADH-ubiquinone oxidoreductase chain 4L n=1 Tax=Aromia bungii TaxID=320466 RepID=A0A7M1I7F1_9CUCU|nr:NADH dehydrogenase subunit 4L [Aromia bungii]QOQ35006.1 NADH dehydrogenase subunit 4L [Aromia bungii]QZI85908.1 NADH dehydrogenase subunit 4L [Aromia bungii]UZA66537.1 NADH dehydrogenase subunit 4L [Aromia bungii]